MKQQKILLLSFPEADVPRHFMYKLPVIGYKAKAHRYINAILKQRNEEMLTAWDEYPIDKDKLQEIRSLIKSMRGFCNDIFLPQDPFIVLAYSAVGYDDFYEPDIINAICRIFGDKLLMSKLDRVVKSLVCTGGLPLVEPALQDSFGEALNFISACCSGANTDLVEEYSTR
mgnify:FL=1